MSARIDKVLRHLRALVAFDTQNPPRQIDPSGLFSYLTDQLDGFECQLDDLGDGCINLLAVRGQPRILFNFHIDTVPASAQWESDPLRLQVENGRATGLGACDIKGAAACMLAAVADSPGDVALLFSSDEEAGKSRCIHHFLEHAPEFDGVVVAEPTRAQAVLAHRGIASGRLQFTGHAGHASDSRAMTDSAIHRAVRWAAAALESGAKLQQQRYRNLQGVRFNIGRIAGGIKPNMIANAAEMKFGLRALPGQDSGKLLTQLAQLAEPAEVGEFEVTFNAPSLPAEDSTYPPIAAASLATSLGLEVGEPVDFWTEAALFSAAGTPALVFGPGDIAQAHTAGEWVSLEQLDEVASIYTRILA